ncbi:MAG: [FeFe] hydrogenase H-cluster radical SAM maturase HydE [Clostridia bacterium]|nr:[FeFe] hydrogenase H-cluster radical SAM maturase HydE [Clostridia bacterium]
MAHADNLARIDVLAREHTLPGEDYLALLTTADEEDDRYLASQALMIKQRVYGNRVFIRGLIEISNFCRNDCYYCGIRASNRACERYRLEEEDILLCCQEGYALGFRTFVLQGGEDGYFTDARLLPLVSEIKTRYPDCAVTLSLGERTRESYAALRRAGADRYLLRHETANPEHYRMLHPDRLSPENRMACLDVLRELGYQVGAGFMVGSPYQTAQMLVGELQFIEAFAPDMCGIGPFIPHKDTPFAAFAPGSVEMTCRLLSCIRLIHPSVLLPATTALGTLAQNGRERGILHGANVVMPNLSPADVRNKYMLYDNKISQGAESAQALDTLRTRLAAIGCEIACDRGDIKKDEE